MKSGNAVQEKSYAFALRIVKLYRYLTEFAPEKVNDFMQLFKATQSKIASFDGCSGVRLLNDVNSKNVFFTHSIWQSEQHLDNYRNSELFKDTWSKTKAMFAGKPLAWSLQNTEL